MDLPSGQRVLRFGPYEVDLPAGELRKHGAKIHIQEKPLRVLAALVERQGQLVTRAELQKHLWPDDTFVDFEVGLNTAVKKLREALGDDAEHPRYIETVPRHGYRFLGGADGTAASVPPGAFAPVAAPGQTLQPSASTRVRAPRAAGFWIAIALSVLGICGVAALWILHGRPVFSFNARDSVLIADFENTTGDPRFDQALQTAFVVSLEQSRHANVFPRGRMGAVLKRMGKGDEERITPAVGREICQRESIRGLIAGSITRTGREYALTAQLIDPASGETVRSYSERSFGEDHILDALDVIAEDIRRDLGESLYQIHRSNRPLPEVTTRSLSALKQFADGSSLWHGGKFNDAMTLFKSAVAADPDFAMAHAALGNGYYSYIYHQPALGKQEYERALALSSRTTDRERLNIRVSYADSAGNLAEAEALYRTYLERYPDDWQMLANHARILRMHGEQRQAIEQYKQILRVAPDDARASVELATAYKALGMFPEALAAYSRAFQIEPQWLTAGNVNREYGFTLVQNGEEEKAVQVFSALLSNLQTRQDGLRSLASLDLLHGRYASARSRLQEALQIARSQHNQFLTARAYFALATVDQGEGNTRKQLEELDAALADFQDLGPKVEYGSLVGQEYARAGALDKAEKIEAMIAPLADSNNPEQVGYVRLLQGEIAVAKGQTEKAIGLLDLRDPGYGSSVLAISREALAHTFQTAGRTDDAIQAYQQLVAPPNRLLSWEPQQRWVMAHYVLATDYLSRGDRARASQALAPLLGLWKGADANLAFRKQMLELEARLTP